MAIGARIGDARRETSALVGTWVFVLSDAIGFVALLTTMAALRASSNSFSSADVGPAMASGLSATGLLAGISISLILARRVPALARHMLGAALLFALGFCALQYHEYQSLLGPNFIVSNPAQESFLVVTGYHLLHVIGGALALLWALPRARLPIGPLSIYWHFVDGLWLFIFGFFYLL